VLALLGALLSACQSGPPPSLVEQGDAALAAGEAQRADALYVRALEEGTAEPARALHGRARVALALRDPERALRVYGDLARADRGYWQRTARVDYGEALFAAGRQRLVDGRAGEAVEALRASRRVDPARAGLGRWLRKALCAHAEALAMHGRRDQALALFREALEVDPGAVGAYVGAAEILIGTGRKQEALALLEVARRADPNDGRVRALTMEAMGLY
jgi:tetratricopeptide (TPR) repeat protein